MKQTIQDSVLTALKSGQELTSTQISQKSAIGNPEPTFFWPCCLS